MIPDATLPAKRFPLWVELWGIFALIPLGVLGLHRHWLLAVVLWSGGAFAYAWLRRQPGYCLKTDWNWQGAKVEAKGIAWRILIVGPALVGVMLWDDPARLFSLPLERPILWVAILVLYPFLSVLPQELLFRSFLHRRYAPLFASPIGIIAASAITFGFAHVVLGNGIAMVLSAIGGGLFALTYQRAHSLALVCIEHTLYGSLIFTLGLGHYFYFSAPH